MPGKTLIEKGTQMTTSTESDQLKERSEEITATLSGMIDAVDEWNSSESDVFPANLETLISASLNIVLSSDVPADLMPLFQQVVIFGDYWARLQNDEPGTLDRDGIPGAEFWSGIEGIRKIIANIDSQTISKGIEPVSQLLDDFRDDPLKYTYIARMYGNYDADRDRYTGPFWLPNQTPNIKLIDQEAANPGSVVPIGYNPLSERRKEIRKESMSALQKVRQRLAANQSPKDGTYDKEPNTSIESMLREGQFPDVIAHGKGIEESVVREEAKRLGIVIQERNEILAAATKESYQRDNAQDDVYRNSQPIRVEQNQSPAAETAAGTAEIDNEMATLSGEDLTDTIESYLDEDDALSTAQVYDRMQQDGVTASKVAIGRALAAIRRQQESA